MTMGPYELVAEAVSRGEMEELLLGREPYAFRDRWSPAPGPTDLTTMWTSGICEYVKRNPSFDMKTELEKCFPRLCLSPEGIDAFSTLILMETSNQFRSQSLQLLDLDKAVALLRQAIRDHREELKSFQELGGAGEPEGLLDDLRRVSKVTVSHGGPGFVDV